MVDEDEHKSAWKAFLRLLQVFALLPTGFGKSVPD